MSQSAVIVLIILIFMLVVIIFMPAQDPEAETATDKSGKSQNKKGSRQEVWGEAPSSHEVVLKERESLQKTGSIPMYDTELSAAEQHLDAPVAVFDGVQRSERELSSQMSYEEMNQDRAVDNYDMYGDPGALEDQRPVSAMEMYGAGPLPEAAAIAAAGQAEIAEREYSREEAEARDMILETIERIHGEGRSYRNQVPQPENNMEAPEERTVSRTLETKMTVAGRGKSKAVYMINSSGSAVYVSPRILPGTLQVRIPAFIPVGGRNYEVVGIREGAFAEHSELTSVLIEPDGLAKNSIKGCFKGSNIERIFIYEDAASYYKRIFTKEITGSKKRPDIKSVIDKRNDL